MEYDDSSKKRRPRINLSGVYGLLLVFFGLCYTLHIYRYEIENVSRLSNVSTSITSGVGVGIERESEAQGEVAPQGKAEQKALPEGSHF